MHTFDLMPKEPSGSYLFDQLAQLTGVERLPRAKNEIWYLRV